MVNWTEFEKLPGSQQHNFEILCRSLILVHYARYGRFAALANQPGVEFHLELRSACTLGEANQWFGWQCRWYDLPVGNQLGAARRQQISEALVKTKKSLPGLTDWVLWTRHTLTKSDQEWFYGQTTDFRLHLWNSADVEHHLSGDGELLKHTYLGELVLTSQILEQSHTASVAQIGRRWLPEAHQAVEAERLLRQMLGEADSWDQLAAISAATRKAAALIANEPRALTEPLATSTTAFIEAVRYVSTELASIYESLRSGNLQVLRQQLEAAPKCVSRELDVTPRRLRGARLACGLEATNALADMKLGVRLLGELNEQLSTPLISIVADAGGGKTQLAAQLTAPMTCRPAGLLFHGRELHSGRTLDDLARAITIHGKPAPSMVALLTALNAAGERACCRLPIVIDGLNEAEAPKDWKPQLAAVETYLKQLPHVLLVVTVRTGARRPMDRELRAHRSETPARLDFAHQALPDHIPQVESQGFAGDTLAAIDKYFSLFRINRGDAELPFELLSHPLTLRIFCEVTNPERKREVILESASGTLTGLFGKYLDVAIARISELSPRHRRYYEQDIRNVLDVFGTELWKTKERQLPESVLRKIIGDDARPWNESVVHLLEQEGVILRFPGGRPGEQDVAPVYDALGGYLIGNSLLPKHSASTLATWLNEASTHSALNGEGPDCHPLALDTVRALVGLVPRRLHVQLWQLAGEPLRSVTLRMAADLEGKYLDGATVNALADIVRENKLGAGNLFIRVLRNRGLPNHPLNAQFLDTTLCTMSVAQRDLVWTEWVRRNSDALRKNAHELGARWQVSQTGRSQNDRLRAKWLMWLLTSTIQALRTKATRALYWFGRGEPEAFLQLVRESLTINDPYVPERMLAVAYGVAMACHTSTDPAFRSGPLQEFGRELYDLMFKEHAPCGTTHLLTTEYARRLLELASLHNPQLFSPAERARYTPPYQDVGLRQWQESASEQGEPLDLGTPFYVDFANYTLGRLVPGRENYDFQHAGYKKVRAQILWRIEQLGWSAERFSEVDRSISRAHSEGRSARDGSKTERYGKKYSWIAYHEMAGLLRDHGAFKNIEDSGRPWCIDFDPSFPAPLPDHSLISADFLGDTAMPLRDWIQNGATPDISPYLRPDEVHGQSGPWLALDGFVTQQNDALGRRLFCFTRAFLVPRQDSATLGCLLSNQHLGGRWLPEKPNVIYAFAGENPWCGTYPADSTTTLSFVTAQRQITMKRMRTDFYLDGNPTGLSVIDVARYGLWGDDTLVIDGGRQLSPEEFERLERRETEVDVEELEDETKEITVQMPVVDFGWEGRDFETERIHAIVLTKQIANALGLVGRPQAFDLFTEQDDRATLSVADKSRGYNNSQEMFFIREDLLRRYLDAHNLDLIWAVWGERGASSAEAIQKDPDHENTGGWHKVFQTIYRFNPTSPATPVELIPPTPPTHP
ncbi:MAG: hypothetical protein WCO56_02200 [Verrucomicrobiota bacterium]